MTAIPSVPGIYRILNIVNGKCYVGSAKSLRRRWWEHSSMLQNNRHHSISLQNAWNKYGPDAFTFEIIELILIPELLIAREQHWMDYYKPFSHKGYNINPVAGSRLGTKQSLETIAKSIAARKGKPSTRFGYKHSPETLEKLRGASTGRKHTSETKHKIAQSRIGKTYGPETRERIRSVTLGHPVSAETRAKLSTIHRSKHQNKVKPPKVSKPRKRVPRTPEWNENIRIARLGHATSPEARERMRSSHLGKNLGHPVSPETRDKIRDTKTGKMQTLIITSPDGVEYTVTGIRQFCIQHALHQSAIMRVAKGLQASHKGYKARYPDTTTS